MLIYGIEELKILLENDETEIVSYAIGPIKKKRYMFICYEKEKNVYLKSSEYDSEELVRFIQEFSQNDMTMFESLEKVIMEDTFIDAYKRKFVRVIEIKNSVLKGLTEQVDNININYPKTKHNGLDGFSLDCYTPKWGKELHLWCCSKDEYFKPVIDLANYLLDFKEVDAGYRFRLVKNS